MRRKPPTWKVNRSGGGTRWHPSGTLKTETTSTDALGKVSSSRTRHSSICKGASRVPFFPVPCFTDSLAPDLLHRVRRAVKTKS